MYIAAENRLTKVIVLFNSFCLEIFADLLYSLYSSFRGFYSRKYEHDFYARKKYLQHVEKKNEEVRAILDSHHKKQLMEESKR